MKIRGLVLAGGKSSRFGTDKALATYQGVSFLERAVTLLDGMCLKPVVIARRERNYSFLTCPVLYDKLPDLGPLGGLYTAMTVFKDTTFLVLTCDMPALDEAALKGLLDSHEPHRMLTFYSMADGTEQPFPGVYEASLFGPICEKIKKETLSMKSLFETLPEKKVVFWRGEPEILRNINYPPVSGGLVFKSRQ